MELKASQLQLSGKTIFVSLSRSIAIKSDASTGGTVRLMPGTSLLLSNSMNLVVASQFHAEGTTVHFSEADLLSLPDFLIVTIGSSNANIKITRVSAGCTCPSSASKANWVGGYTHLNKFTITQNGTNLAAQRTDSAAGWGMNLRITCACVSGVPPY